MQWFLDNLKAFFETISGWAFEAVRQLLSSSIPDRGARCFAQSEHQRGPRQSGVVDSVKSAGFSRESRRKALSVAY